jgi:hypothetical protein
MVREIKKLKHKLVLLLGHGKGRDENVSLLHIPLPQWSGTRVLCVLHQGALSQFAI